MKTISFIGKMVAVMTIALSSINVYAREKERRTIDAADFSELHITSAIDVKVTQGTDYSVTAVGESKDLDNLIVETKGEKLKISRKGRSGSKGVTIEITTPVLNKLTLAGASDADLINIKTGDFVLNCSGASDVEGSIEAKDISIESSGASDISLRVICKDIELNCSGASDIDLEGRCGDIYGSVTGASDINLSNCRTGKVDISRSGFGKFKSPRR